MSVKQVSAGVIVHNNKILIAQRKHGKTCEYLWEFPGGKLEDGETMQECLRRELQEELKLDINVGAFFMKSEYTYEFGTVVLNVYFADCESSDLSYHPDHEQACWVSPEELEQYSFPPADKPIVEALKKIDLTAVKIAAE